MILACEINKYLYWHRLKFLNELNPYNKLLCIFICKHIKAVRYLAKEVFASSINSLIGSESLKTTKYWKRDFV